MLGTWIAVSWITGALAFALAYWIRSRKWLSRSLSIICLMLAGACLIFPEAQQGAVWTQWSLGVAVVAGMGLLPGVLAFIYGPEKILRKSLILGFTLAVTVPLLGISPEPRKPWPEGRVLKGGFVLQTTRKSCAAAAAATLLRQLKLNPGATEAELGELCKTDALSGTKDKDLVAGLQRCSGQRARITVISFETLRARSEPCILFVGLSRERAGTDDLYQTLRDDCGWIPGESHTICFLGFESGESGERIVIADPRIGVERWGLDHFHALWDHRILSLKSKKP